MTQIPLFQPPSEWTPPEKVPNLSEAKEIAVDLETYDPDIKTKGPGWAINNGYIAGVAIAVEGWKGYFPIGHEGGGNMDARQISKYLKKVFECPADKVMHNAQYDLGWIQAMGFEVKGRVIDTMLTAALIDTVRRNSTCTFLTKTTGRLKWNCARRWRFVEPAWRLRIPRTRLRSSTSSWDRIPFRSVSKQDCGSRSSRNRNICYSGIRQYQISLIVYTFLSIRILN